MPKFSIEVARETYETTWIDVEADDLIAAEAAAIEAAKNIEGAKWSDASTEYNIVDQQMKWEMLGAMEKDVGDSITETVRSQ